MRQLIIGADVAGPHTGAAKGALCIQQIDAATGIPSTVNLADAALIKAGDKDFRLVRLGATEAEALVASPWVKPSQLMSFTAKTYSAGAKQVLKNDCATAGTAGKEFIYKVIVTSSGYEPFKRYSFHSSVGANAGATATALELVIQAAITAGTHPELSDVAVASTDQIHLTMADGERAVVVIDPLESGTVWTREAETAFAFPVGTAAKLLKEELEQEGRENSNYDRFTALPDEVLTYVDLTEIYNEYTLRFANPAQGQIRGVDNIREIKLAIPSGANTPYLDGGTNGDSSAESFEYIMLALTGVARLKANGN